MKMRRFLVLFIIVLSSCTPYVNSSKPSPSLTDDSQADMPNPASVYCEEKGGSLEIRTADDGSQSGVCIFPDGSECDEWAFFRGECNPTYQSEININPTEVPTVKPIDPADYQGWWTYTHHVYNFSIMLPEDWVVEEITISDQVMNGHILQLHPKNISGKENIRMTFRQEGEEIQLWPSGVGQGEFIAKGTLDIAGQPAQRKLLLCPTGEITSIWYQQAEGEPNIIRGELEFGFIFSIGTHCESGLSLSGKLQYTGELILASLNVP